MALISSQTGAAASFPRPSGAPEHREEAMSLKEYDVEINGHKTTIQFSDEDAERHGLTAADVRGARKPTAKAAKAPANKAAPAPENKAE